MKMPEWVTYTYTPVIIAIIGALLAIGAAAIQAHTGDLAEKKRNREFQALLEKSNEALTGNKRTLEKADDQLSKLQVLLNDSKKLVKSQSEMIESLNETQSDLTGGESYCYLTFSPAYGINKTFVSLTTVGNHHLRDVDIRILHSKSGKSYQLSFPLIKQGKTNQLVLEIPLPDPYKFDLYTIFSSSFSQTWNQQVVIHTRPSRGGARYDINSRVYKLEIFLQNNKKEHKFELLKKLNYPKDESTVNKFNWTYHSQHLMENGTEYVEIQ